MSVIIAAPAGAILTNSVGRIWLKKTIKKKSGKRVSVKVADTKALQMQ